MDLIAKDLILNADDEENVDGVEELGDPEEFKEEAPSSEDDENI